MLLWIPFALKSSKRSTIKLPLHRYKFTQPLAGDEVSNRVYQKWPKLSIFSGVLYTLLVLAALLMSECESRSDRSGEDH